MVIFVDCMMDGIAYKCLVTMCLDILLAYLLCLDILLVPRLVILYYLFLENIPNFIIKYIIVNYIPSVLAIYTCA